MKVLYLTNLPAPYRMRFFQELGKLCDLTAVFETEKASDRNVKWFESNFDKTFQYDIMPGIHWGNDSAFNPSVIRRLSRKCYDIIVIGGYSSPTQILSAFYMKFRRIPFVISSDGGFAAEHESGIKRRFKKLLVSSAHAWLASGNKTRDYLKFYGADRERTYNYPFTSIGNDEVLTVPLKSFEKEEYKKMLGLTGLIVLSAGQFIPRKGFDVLLEAWRKVKHESAGLIIVGDGLERDRYLEIIRDSGLKNVTILDFMNKDELMQYYRAADVFVLPTRYDIWGLVINEAMAQGLPVITTNGALSGLELVHDGENGYLVPAGDAEALAGHIELVLSDAGLREGMAAHAIDTIRPYTIENMAGAYFKAFQAILRRDEV